MNKNLLLPFSLVVGLIGASLIISKPWVTIQHAEPIMVKGYAEQEVLADQGSLTVRVSKSELKMPRPTKPLKHRFRWSRASLLKLWGKRPRCWNSPHPSAKPRN